jgi:hypothetical protein
MKKVSNIFTSIALLSLLLFVSCKKEDTTPAATTGGVSVNIKIVQRSTGAIVPDNKITNWVINASLWSDGGALLKTQTFNSSQFIFSNLVPANYKITANGTLTLNGVTYSLTGGISGGQVAAGTTVPGAEMTFYY